MIINGTNFGDTLNGTSGNDTFEGFGGDDVMTGNGGNDTYKYTTRGFGSDRITDFNSGDRINLSALNIGDFASLQRFISSDSLGNAVITLGYGGTTERITLTGVSAASLNASNFIFNTSATGLTVNGETVYNDVLFGGRGNDSLFGFSGHDTLSAGAGNDRLNGGSGDDTLIGGAGADVFVYTDRGFGADRIEDFTQGQDKIDLSALNIGDFASLQRFISSDSLGNAVITLGYGGTTERITLAGVAASSLNANSFIFNANPTGIVVEGETVYNDVLFGGKGNDQLFGYSGHDTLTGGAGNDVLNGGSGDDTLAGGIGTDVFAYTARGFGSDTIVDFQRGGDKINLSFLNIADFETLKRFISADAYGNAVITLGYGGTSEKITLNGIAPSQLAAGHFIFNTNTTNLVVEGETVYNDVLFGGRGNDQLFGYSGHDTLSGGAGNDTLNGGSGDDLLVGGAGRDVFNYTARGFGADTIADFTQGQDKINLSALNVADFASLQRFISSDAYGNAVITLGYGGSTEKITLTGVAASSLNANSFIFNTLTTNLTVTGETVYSDVLFGGKGNDTLYGLSGHDTLIGGAGNDILYGESGDDLLDGGIGADQMRGGTGNDVYFVDRAGDTIVELAGEGNDTVNTTVSLVLRNGVEIETLQTTDAAGTGAINLTGNAFAQTINGNAGANVLLGMGGDDRLNGNAGNDRLDGGAGNDSLDGGAGADILLGGLGNDALNGGLGADKLTGGAGQDAFVFNTALGAGNIDTITDFYAPHDTIQLENAIFTAFNWSSGPLAASAFKVLGSGAVDADDRIIYNASTGALYYDADGSGTAFGRVQFATLTGSPTITAADFVII